jgi:hypothetical protein
MNELIAKLEAGERGNLLDVLIEIALFEPDGVYISVRANAAGTEAVYTRADGLERTHWARDWSRCPEVAIPALKARNTRTAPAPSLHSELADEAHEAWQRTAWEAHGHVKDCRKLDWFDAYAKKLIDARRPLAEVDADVRRHWKLGNLTRLGVCNMLVRGGFNQVTAIAKSDEICGPVKAPDTARIAALEEAAKSARHFIVEVLAEKVSSAEYARGELHSDCAADELLNVLDSMMYDGTIASYREELDAALANKATNVSQEGER